MTIRDHMNASGVWLFRWRSYLPLLLVMPTIVAMKGYTWPFGSYRVQEVWEAFCALVAFGGLAVRVLTVGFVPGKTSGRNTKYQQASHLNTTGMYSVVRHPLYLGNYFMYMGVSLFPRVWWAPLLMSLAFFLYYERIIYTEEDFLRKTHGGRFEAWAMLTPAFFPRLKNWKSPSLPFSFRTVLRREYSGLMGVVCAFFVLELIEHYIVEDRIVFEADWTACIPFTAVVYLLLRGLKRNTNVLYVQGR